MAGRIGVDGDGTMNFHLLENPGALQARIIELLTERCGCESLFQSEPYEGVRTSGVLLLLAKETIEPGRPPEACVILNKRSEEVRQPGDLCCPGGAVEGNLDPTLSKLLTLPGMPLARWPHWRYLRRDCPEAADFLSLLLATAIRESWEEMRLNPFFIRFLGPLQSQCLILFRRVVHPMVAWVRWQKRFRLSREVEKIVRIPLRSLLDPSLYGCYRLTVPPHLEWRFQGEEHDFPCFLQPNRDGADLLWGVTYRMVTLLVELVFGFKPPPLASLPVTRGTLDSSYISGNKKGAAGLRRTERREGNRCAVGE
jgi:8-oxo-dGTP pyrophosphatase MutT (NUDIX family)